MKKDILLTATVAFSALFSSQCLRAEDAQKAKDESFLMSVELQKVIDGQPSELISSSDLPLEQDEVTGDEIATQNEAGDVTKIAVETLVETRELIN